MDVAIDRRLRRDLFWFILQDPEFYDEPRPAPAAVQHHRQLLASFVPPEWMVAQEGIWLHAVPPKAALPLQGFKLHMSGTSLTALELIRKVVPICVENRTAFKVMADPWTLEMTTSKNYSRGASGKFITIYPADNEQLVKLAELLDKATSGMAGPYILSDRRYRDSKVVFYRYGGFAPRFVLNIYGENVPVIHTTDGRLVADVRTPFFQLPEGVADPLQSEDPSKPGQVLLNNRYAVREALVHSNSGGVYKAEDQRTGKIVIIKEARPFINVTRQGDQNAVTTLKKEARILGNLEHTGYTPKLIDFFQEWEHFFLVEEYVQGVQLSSYRARKDVVLILQRRPSDDDIKSFCTRLYRIAANLIRAIQMFHREGIILGDISPYNILIDPETLELKIIDFEAASIAAEPRAADAFALFTPGFASPNRREAAQLSQQDDFYSLASVIYSLIFPVQEIFQLNPEAADLFIDEIAADLRLPPSVKELIFALYRGEVSWAQTIAECADLDRAESSAIIRPHEDRSAEINDAIKGIANYILSKTEPNRPDRLWPADYRLFTTNPMNVAYGAVGTALFLKSANGKLPDIVERWLDQQHLSPENYPPGLFIGLSGIAWGLHELGFTDKARAAIDLALESPLLAEGADVFYGTAGVGLTSLYFFQQTGDEKYLAKARELGNALVARASMDENGCYWTNVDGVNYFGHCHGGSGIGLFLLYLYRATGDATYLSFATRALDYEIAHARIDEDSAAWDRAEGDSLELPYWRFGSGGIGSTLIRFFAVTGEQRYRELAQKVANHAVTKYAVFSGQFAGLSGIGEFLIDMFHFTGERRYLDDAYRIAAGVLLFQIKRPEGVAFPGEELLRLCTDYGTGSAGVGMFLMRLLQPGGRLFFDLDVQAGNAIELTAINEERAR